MYYVCADGQLNRLDTHRRKLRHRIITSETAETELDAHALAQMGADGTAVRKLQIDKKRNIVLIEPDGTKKPMTFKEVSLTFGGDVIMRLTQGIQLCGADISTVELDD